MNLTAYDKKRAAWKKGALLTELVVAMGILAVVVLPISVGFIQDVKTCHKYFQRAQLIEMMDGEMEILASGEWRSFAPGKHPYAVRAERATDFPPGRFELTLSEGRARLEWIPEGRIGIPAVVREAALK